MKLRKVIVLLNTASYIFLGISLLLILYMCSFSARPILSFIQQDQSLYLTYYQDFKEIPVEKEILYYKEDTLYLDTITKIDPPKYQIHLQNGYITPSQYYGTLIYSFPILPIPSIITFLQIALIPPIVVLLFVSRYSIMKWYRILRSTHTIRK